MYKEVITYLQRKYNNPNYKEKAITDFTNLKIYNTNRFN